MASIQKRGKKHAVVYTYTDQEGQKRQKWETFNTKAEARKRKSAVEAELDNGTFIPPNTTTVEDFLKEFVDLYGEKKWGLSIYASNTALINNYINPLIGNLVVQDINKRTVDKYIQQLQKTAPINTPYRHAKTEYVTPCTIEKIIKLLRCAFHQAVRWDIIGKNPFEDADLPKREKKVRAIWTADIIRQALNNCQDGKLYIAINLAFACSMRMGGKSSTRLVLKKPKTESSIRKVWLPKTLALILRDWKEKQDRLKEFMGPDYTDYNLVLAQETGRPCEDRIIGNQFERLKKSAGLPNVVFHSLRHSSTTYKLKLNKGDLKATQGDTGHAQIDMITEIYAHILDEDRKINAQKFETAFYSNPDMRPVERSLQGEGDSVPNPDVMMKQLESSPQAMDAFIQKFIEQYGDQIMKQLAKKCSVHETTQHNMGCNGST